MTNINTHKSDHPADEKRLAINLFGWRIHNLKQAAHSGEMKKQYNARARLRPQTTH